MDVMPKLQAVSFIVFQASSNQALWSKSFMTQLYELPRDTELINVRSSHSAPRLKIGLTICPTSGTSNKVRNFPDPAGDVAFLSLCEPRLSFCLSTFHHQHIELSNQALSSH
jgi:hypothetical protein